MRILLVILLVSIVGTAQESSLLANAPSTVQPPKPAEKQGFWCCWNYRWDGVKTRSNWQTLANKPYLFSVLGDFGAGAFDAEMSHEGYAHHRCVEGDEGLPPYASRAQLYVHNLPEQAFVAGFGFLVTKVKVPRWFMPALVTYPTEAHLRAGLKWYENCW